ncbi:DMT family transporter [Sporolactobacillus sp. KGMB 08714]|uniref:DMT family transporter n=1 Tax=Sporolactobacillus sp. KGMB 08714 TaxID=3064704 RepID=UPI002FBE068F
MDWLYLIIAGLFEVVWATMMKLSAGFTRWDYSLYTILGIMLSFFFLARATKVLPLSIAYPVWTGIGAVGAIIIGVIFFKDGIPFLTWIFIGLLIICIIGIKVTSGH